MAKRLEDLSQLIGQLIALLPTSVSTKDLKNALRRSGTRRAREKGVTISGLCKQYLRFADTYYFKTDSGSTVEPGHIECALRPVRRLYGRSAAGDFGPRRLKMVREEMIKSGWCRTHVNQQVGRVKRMFRWATENELVAPSTYHALQAVSGLKAGRTVARETPPVKPVADDLIAATLASMPPHLAAMVQLQLLTGMRPGELVIMRHADIDQTAQPWCYRPARHKTAHHGHERTIFLGPRSQAILKPFLRPEAPEGFLFSPANAEAERRRRLHQLRRTPLSCGNRPGSNRKRRPRRKPRDRYDTNSYSGAIAYACRRAFPIPSELDADAAAGWRKAHHWHPHQLRHNAATLLRRECGLDAAQAVLGHRTLEVTQVYAERHEQAARDAMLRFG
jgi:integrase